MIQKSLFVYLYFGNNVKPEDLQECLCNLAMKSLNSSNLCNLCALWKVKLLQRRLLSLTSSWYWMGDAVIRRYRINRGNCIENSCLYVSLHIIQTANKIKTRLCAYCWMSPWTGNPCAKVTAPLLQFKHRSEAVYIYYLPGRTLEPDTLHLKWKWGEIFNTWAPN